MSRRGISLIILPELARRTHLRKSLTCSKGATVVRNAGESMVSIFRLFW